MIEWTVRLPEWVAICLILLLWINALIALAGVVLDYRLKRARMKLALLNKLNREISALTDSKVEKP